MSILRLPPTKVAPSAGDPLLPSASGVSGTPGAAPEAPFAAILDGERGRLFDARSDRDDLDAPPASEADGSAATATAPPAEVAAALVAPAASAAEPADSPPGSVAGDAGHDVAGQSASTTAAVPTAVAGVAAARSSSTVPTPVTATPTGVSVAAASAPAGAVVAAATEPAGETIAALDSGGADLQSVAPRATPVHQGTPSDSLPDGPQDEASTSAASFVPVAGAAKGLTSARTSAAPVADAAPQSSAPAATTTTGPPVATQALDGTASPESTPTTRTVGLDRAVETVRLALRAAADRGVTHARISLNPRELGGIEIHLRHTADGLVARVVAEHAGAAQLLQHAGAELRRALEAQGVTLLALDIGASADEGGRAAGGQRGFGEAGSRRSDGSASPGEGSSLGEAADGTPAPDATLALANGVLVDVLA